MHFCDRHVCSIQYAATRRLQLRAWPTLCTGLRPVQLFLVIIMAIIRLSEKRKKTFSALSAAAGSHSTEYSLTEGRVSKTNATTDRS